MSFVGDPAILLRQLVELGDRERDHLAAGEWEQADEVRADFDSRFAQLQKVVEDAPLTASSRNDLVRLQHLNGENLRLRTELRDQAGAELAELSNVIQLRGYKPLGPDHTPAPRYLDSSA